MNVNLIFHPLNFKKPQQIFADKRVEVFSFPVKHSISTCGLVQSGQELGADQLESNRKSDKDDQRNN